MKLLHENCRFFDLCLLTEGVAYFHINSFNTSPSDNSITINGLINEDSIKLFVMGSCLEADDLLQIEPKPHLEDDSFLVNESVIYHVSLYFYQNVESIDIAFNQPISRNFGQNSRTTYSSSYQVHLNRWRL